MWREQIPTFSSWLFQTIRCVILRPCEQSNARVTSIDREFRIPRDHSTNFELFERSARSTVHDV